jgi:hypothetical protein
LDSAKIGRSLIEANREAMSPSSLNSRVVGQLHIVRTTRNSALPLIGSNVAPITISLPFGPRRECKIASFFAQDLAIVEIDVSLSLAVRCGML